MSAVVGLLLAGGMCFGQAKSITKQQYLDALIQATWNTAEGSPVRITRQGPTGPVLIREVIDKDHARIREVKYAEQVSASREEIYVDHFYYFRKRGGNWTCSKYSEFQPQDPFFGETLKLYVDKTPVHGDRYDMYGVTKYEVAPGKSLSSVSMDQYFIVDLKGRLFRSADAAGITMYEYDIKLDPIKAPPASCSGVYIDRKAH